MNSILKTKLFWVTILTVLLVSMLIELLLRAGVTAHVVKPKSYLGTIFYRVKALNDYGLENVEWITVGDSRVDWGFDHGLIYETKKKHIGLNHIRLSIESSEFFAIQTLIDWSYDNLPNLKGITIGLSEFNLSHFDDLAKQYKVAWPFIEYEDHNKYIYNPNVNVWNRLNFQNGFSIFGLDTKNLLLHLSKRIKEIKEFHRNELPNVLFATRKLKNNLCNYKLSTVRSCYETAVELQSKSNPSGVEKFLINKCATQSNVTNKNIKDQRIINNWMNLFNSISKKGILLEIVYLPEHVIYKEILTKKFNKKHLNNGLEKLQGVTILDLSTLFQDRWQQCMFFRDPTHYSEMGLEILTQHYLDKFVYGLNSGK